MRKHQPAFDFLARPPRSVKPRKRGITVTSDKAKSLADAASLIEMAGDIVDHMKIPDHVGVMWRYPAALLKKKNALYAKAGIDTLPGGIPFEVAAVQGKVPQFMARVAELGFKGVEVSEDSLDLAPGDRLNAIKHALANGLTVFTELGKKLPDQPLHAEEAIEMANQDLEAGTHLVVVEKSDVALVIKQASDTLHRLMRGVGSEHLIIECGPGADRFEIAKWLIREFGPDVNLENIDAEDAYIIEAMRHGMHRAVDYSYFHDWRGKKLPRITSPRG
jgi:phosphosulfolactate synthase